MSIRLRLLVTLTLVGIALTVISLYVLVDLYRKFREAERVETSMKEVELALLLVHELQKERGMSAGFIASSGAKFSEALKIQRRETDKRLKALGSKLLKEKVKGLVSKLPEIRRAVDSMELSVAEAVSFYTSLNHALIESYVGKLPFEFKKLDAELVMKLISLEDISFYKDMEGINRALVSAILAKGSFDQELMRRFYILKGRREEAKSFAYRHAPENYLPLLKSLEEDKAFREAHSVEKNVEQGIFDIDPQEWFNLATAKINRIAQLERDIVEDVKIHADRLKTVAYEEMVFVGAVLAVILTFTLFLSIKTLLYISRRIAMVVGKIRKVGETMELKVSKTETNYRDELKQLEDAFENMIRTFSMSLSSIGNTMEKVAEGDLSARVENSFKGDLKKLSDNVNRSLENLQNLMDSIAHALEEVSRGNLEAEVKGNFKGTLKLLADNVNGSLKKLRILMESIGQTMEDVSRGNLEVRVEGEFEGTLKFLVDNINSSLSGLHELMNSIAKTMEEVSKGNLGVRIEGDFKGTLKLLVENINSSLQNLQSILSSIAKVMEEVSKGNLTVKLDVKTSGELKELVEHINNSIENLKELVSGVKGNVERIADEINAVAVSVDQTTEAITRISEETMRAKSVSDSVRESVYTSQEKVRLMTEVMNSMLSLSKDINSITETIMEIAEQTSLLALNAAIEAARAGEAGRGFAVVADEVRKLSERTSQATKNIAMLVDKAIESIEEGYSASEEVVKSFKKIEEVAEVLLSSINSIATAMEEQSAAVSTIRENAINVSKSAEDIKGGIRQLRT